MFRLLILILWAACNHSSLPSGTDGGADLAQMSACAHDAPGAAFTFHITNTGSRMLSLFYGCMHTLPITLDTSQGALPISPGPADYCEINCDFIFAGGMNNSCSDCGPGYGANLPPGSTVDIAWDRRVYVGYKVDAACSGHPGGNHCGLGILIDNTVKSGTLTVLSGGGGTTGGPTTQISVPFTFDPTSDQTTINVQ
jgi:hypothetical protein